MKNKLKKEINYDLTIISSSKQFLLNQTDIEKNKKNKTTF